MFQKNKASNSWSKLEAAIIERTIQGNSKRFNFDCFHISFLNIYVQIKQIKSDCIKFGINKNCSVTKSINS